jgi:hypothetical protein
LSHTHTITLLFPLSLYSQSQPAKTNTCALSFSAPTRNLKNVCCKHASRSSHGLLPSPYLREIKTDSFKFICLLRCSYCYGSMRHTDTQVSTWIPRLLSSRSKHSETNWGFAIWIHYELKQEMAVRSK